MFGISSHIVSFCTSDISAVNWCDIVINSSHLFISIILCLVSRSSNSGYATPYVYNSYGECVARVDALAAGLDKGGENLLDKNDDGMLLVRNNDIFDPI